MVTIRVFRTRYEADKARKLLVEAGLYAEVTEDKIYGTPIQEYNVPARFRLNVFNTDLKRVSEFLTKRLKDRK